MRVGIVISTADAETNWNALRFANFSLKQGDEVRVFLIGKGVEYEKSSSRTFDAAAQARALLSAGGRIYACGTCLKSREQGGTEICPISTMKDLHEIVRESDRLLTF